MADLARKTAFEVIDAVLANGAPLDEALEQAFAGARGLATRDRAFARNLAATVLRRRGALDHALSQYLKRPLPNSAAWVKTWLYLGAAQILFLEVPDHAAVETAVAGLKTTSRQGAGGFAGLVNAVLRNVARNRETHLREIEKNPGINLPPWLWRRWVATFGEKTAAAIAQASLAAPPLDLCLKAAEDKKDLMKALKTQEVFERILRLEGAGRIEALTGFREGKWWAMDIAASLPPGLLGDVRAKRVLDLCAAPGGKTLYLASRGAKVSALDQSAARLARLKENLERTALSAEVICADALEYQPREKFGAVLLDAPCSATGTLRRHPDVPWRRSEDDIARLARLQAKLLERAISFLAPGGRLVYCVCSLEPEEGPNVIGEFLAAKADAVREPVTAAEVGGHKEWITPSGDLRTLPCHMAEQGGMDGFFAARIARKQG